MTVVDGLTLQDQTVTMDEKHFVGCSLQRCTLEYRGGRLTLEETALSDCRLLFLGDAGRTLHLLQCLGYVTDIVDMTVPDAEPVM
jgi:hypothetical protein